MCVRFKPTNNAGALLRLGCRRDTRFDQRGEKQSTDGGTDRRKDRPGGL